MIPTFHGITMFPSAGIPRLPLPMYFTRDMNGVYIWLTFHTILIPLSGHTAPDYLLRRDRPLHPPQRTLRRRRQPPSPSVSLRRTSFSVMPIPPSFALTETPRSTWPREKARPHLEVIARLASRQAAKPVMASATNNNNSGNGNSNDDRHIGNNNIGNNGLRRSLARRWQLALSMSDASSAFSSLKSDRPNSVV